MTEIRPCRPEDRDDVYDVCVRTADGGPHVLSPLVSLSVGTRTGTRRAGVGLLRSGGPALP